MLLRVDFLDCKDLLCDVNELLGGFRPIHCGFKLHDHYICPPRSSDGPAVWIKYDQACRYYGRYVVHSFGLTDRDYDPCLLALIPDGVVVSSPWRLAWTELVHWGANEGLWRWKPHRINCAGIISMMLQTMDYPITATTSHHLYKQLNDLSLNPRSGIRKLQ